MVCYSHVFKNFPEFVVIHTVKGFAIVNKAEIDFFWNSFAFLMIKQIVGNLNSGSFAFSFSFFFLGGLVTNVFLFYF